MSMIKVASWDDMNDDGDNIYWSHSDYDDTHNDTFEPIDDSSYAHLYDYDLERMFVTGHHHDEVTPVSTTHPMMLQFLEDNFGNGDSPLAERPNNPMYSHMSKLMQEELERMQRKRGFYRESSRDNFEEIKSVENISCRSLNRPKFIVRKTSPTCSHKENNIVSVNENLCNQGPMKLYLEQEEIECGTRKLKRV